MRKEAHLLIGCGLFCVYSIPVLILTPINLSMAFWPFVVAAFGSIIPDIIEPAYHWDHRRFFHGTAILRLFTIIALITGMIAFLTIINGIFYYSYFVSGFFLGYASHLIADSTTKMSIPETQWPEWMKFPKKISLNRDVPSYRSTTEITEKDKQKAVSLKEIGNSFYKKGDFQKALEYYEKGLRLDPTNPNIIHNKGMALARLGRSEEEDKKN